MGKGDKEGRKQDKLMSPGDKVRGKKGEKGFEENKGKGEKSRD